VRRFPDRNPQNHRSTYLATLKIRNREPSQVKQLTAARQRFGVVTFYDALGHWGKLFSVLSASFHERSGRR